MRVRRLGGHARMSQDVVRVVVAGVARLERFLVPTMKRRVRGLAERQVVARTIAREAIDREEPPPLENVGKQPVLEKQLLLVRGKEVFVDRVEGAGRAERTDQVVGKD